MKVHVELEVAGISLDSWIGMVKKEHKDVQFILETGKGETYGDVGSVTAAMGPDMQADVVGVWSETHAFVVYSRTTDQALDYVHVTIDLSNQ